VTEAESRARLAQTNSEHYQALYRQNFVAKEMADRHRHEASAATAALAAARANTPVALARCAKLAAPGPNCGASTSCAKASN